MTANELRSKFVNLLAEKTRDNPAFIHLDMLGLAKLESSNDKRLLEFEKIITDTVRSGGNICIPSYSLSYTRNEEYNMLSTPCVNVGAVSEYIRENNVRKRTVDALFSYIIPGNKISGKHFEAGDYESFGGSSVIEEVFNLDGYVCAIGGVFKNSTEIHFIEKLLEVNYRHNKNFTGQITDLNGYKSDQQVTYFCKKFDYNLWYDFKELENDLRDDGLMETIKVDGFPLFITAVRFRLLYDYIEQKIRKDIKYFIKDLKDKRDIRKIES